MRIRRHFTVEGHSPYEGIAFRNAASEIRNPDGSIVFAQTDIEVPESWSQVASDVLAQKYFRKAGVPKALKPVAEEGVPEFLWRRQAGKDSKVRWPCGLTACPFPIPWQRTACCCSRL